MEIAAKLKTLNKQLANDPYQISLLYEKALLNILINNESEVAKILGLLARIPGLEVQTSPLLSLSIKESVLMFSGKFWFIFPEESDHESRQSIIDLAQKHFDKLLKITGRKIQGITVFELTPYPVSYLDYSIDGLNFVKLSGLISDYDTYSSTIAHELSHIFWPCKNRVISEGIALVYENILAPEGAFIPSISKAVEYVNTYKSAFPSITTLLTNSFQDDVFFERRTSSSDEQVLIYNLAFLLIKFYSESANSKNIDSLIATINKSEDKLAETIFLSLCGKSPDELRFFLNYPEVSDSSIVDLQKIDNYVLEDRRSNKDTSYEKFYQSLHLQCVSTEVEVLKARVLLMRLYSQCSQSIDIDLVTLYEVEQLAETLSDKGLVTESSYIRARISVIKLMRSTDVIEKSQLMPEIHGYFQESLGKNSLKSEAYIDYAKFELATPIAFGRNIAKVNELLEVAGSDLRYTQEIDYIKTQIARMS